MDVCPSMPEYCMCGAGTIIFEAGCFASYPTLKILAVGDLAFKRPCALGRHLLIEMCSAMRARRAGLHMAATHPLTAYLSFRFMVDGLMHGVAIPVKDGSVLARLRVVQRQVRRWYGRRLAARRLGVAMATHQRLGAASALAGLTDDLLRLCVCGI